MRLLLSVEEVSWENPKLSENCRVHLNIEVSERIQWTGLLTALSVTSRDNHFPSWQLVPREGLNILLMTDKKIYNR